MWLLFSNGSLPLLMCFHEEHIKNLLISRLQLWISNPHFKFIYFLTKNRRTIFLHALKSTPLEFKTSRCQWLGCKVHPKRYIRTHNSISSFLMASVWIFTMVTLPVLSKDYMIYLCMVKTCYLLCHTHFHCYFVWHTYSYKWRAVSE